MLFFLLTTGSSPVSASCSAGTFTFSENTKLTKLRLPMSVIIHVNLNYLSTLIHSIRSLTDAEQ
ncbi:hypothetical protein KC19_VG297200 [Ceratodon purpureus]|uniref:Uncharacterized protein n=1 Tax=Ceratodon purpureus TaxID=3225 RepID=A0A8T0HV33_CERPU|nr:hypothetical protein KC19_VG297200 [Ceratodon purpureus]